MKPTQSLQTPARGSLTTRRRSSVDSHASVRSGNSLTSPQAKPTRRHSVASPFGGPGGPSQSSGRDPSPPRTPSNAQGQGCHLVRAMYSEARAHYAAIAPKRHSDSDLVGHSPASSSSVPGSGEDGASLGPGETGSFSQAVKQIASAPARVHAKSLDEDELGVGWETDGGNGDDDGNSKSKGNNNDNCNDNDSNDDGTDNRESRPNCDGGVGSSSSSAAGHATEMTPSGSGSVAGSASAYDEERLRRSQIARDRLVACISAFKKSAWRVMHKNKAFEILTQIRRESERKSIEEEEKRKWSLVEAQKVAEAEAQEARDAKRHRAKAEAELKSTLIELFGATEEHVDALVEELNNSTNEQSANIHGVLQRLKAAGTSNLDLVKDVLRLEGCEVSASAAAGILADHQAFLAKQEEKRQARAAKARASILLQRQEQETVEAEAQADAMIRLPELEQIVEQHRPEELHERESEHASPSASEAGAARGLGAKKVEEAAAPPARLSAVHTRKPPEPKQRQQAHLPFRMQTERHAASEASDPGSPPDDARSSHSSSSSSSSESEEQNVEQANFSPAISISPPETERATTTERPQIAAEASQDTSGQFPGDALAAFEFLESKAAPSEADDAEFYETQAEDEEQYFPESEAMLREVGKQQDDTPILVHEKGPSAAKHVELSFGQENTPSAPKTPKRYPPVPRRRRPRPRPIAAPPEPQLAAQPLGLLLADSEEAQPGLGPGPGPGPAGPGPGPGAGAWPRGPPPARSSSPRGAPRTGSPRASSPKEGTSSAMEELPTLFGQSLGSRQQPEEKDPPVREKQEMSHERQLTEEAAGASGAMSVRDALAMNEASNSTAKASPRSARADMMDSARRGGWRRPIAYQSSATDFVDSMEDLSPHRASSSSSADGLDPRSGSRLGHMCALLVTAKEKWEPVLVPRTVRAASFEGSSIAADEPPGTADSLISRLSLVIAKLDDEEEEAYSPPPTAGSRARPRGPAQSWIRDQVPVLDVEGVILNREGRSRVLFPGDSLSASDFGTFDTFDKLGAEIASTMSLVEQPPVGRLSSKLHAEMPSAEVASGVLPTRPFGSNLNEKSRAEVGVKSSESKLSFDPTICFSPVLPGSSSSSRRPTSVWGKPTGTTRPSVGHSRVEQRPRPLPNIAAPTSVTDPPGNQHYLATRILSKDQKPLPSLSTWVRGLQVVEEPIWERGVCRDSCRLLRQLKRHPFPSQTMATPSEWPSRSSTPRR